MIQGLTSRNVRVSVLSREVSLGIMSHADSFGSRSSGSGLLQALSSQKTFCSCLFRCPEFPKQSFVSLQLAQVYPQWLVCSQQPLVALVAGLAGVKKDSGTDLEDTNYSVFFYGKLRWLCALAFLCQLYEQLFLFRGLSGVGIEFCLQQSPHFTRALYVSAYLESFHPSNSVLVFSFLSLGFCWSLSNCNTGSRDSLFKVCGPVSVSSSNFVCFCRQTQRGPGP